MSAVTVSTAGFVPLNDLQRRILSHCDALRAPGNQPCTFTPVGLVAASPARAREVYGHLVYGYGVDIFVAFVQGKIGIRKYKYIAEFVDMFATQIEYAIGLKKGGLAEPVEIKVTQE